ncbi:PGF-CTERM sorting domain-containing protein [Halococcoides cellulosivorans]|nr:PGF-CTERM sorting domain-containing protein [Halococcoides cellulosivorans]
MTTSRTGIALVGIVAALLVTSGVAVAAPSISASAGDAAPGETVTVEMTVQEVGVLSVTGIPSDWEIESYDSAGGTPQVGTTDGAQKIGWTWNEDRSADISVTLAVPDDASDASLTIEASNIADETVTESLTVAVEDGSDDSESDGGDGGVGGGENIDIETDDPTTEASDESTAEDTETESEDTGADTDEATTDDAADVNEGGAESSPTEQSDSSPTDAGGPGFSAALALIALVAVAALARRA